MTNFGKISTCNQQQKCSILSSNQSTPRATGSDMAAGTGGWIKVHRCLCENWLWSDRPFSKGQAWIDLLLMANHEPHRLKTRTGFVELERGSFHTEERSLAARWGWSGTKVRNFLTSLESEKMILKTVKKITITMTK